MKEVSKTWFNDITIVVIKIVIDKFLHIIQLWSENLPIIAYKQARHAQHIFEQ